MDFIFKKTTELSNDELNQISSLFEVVFKKKRSPEIFLNQYLNNVLGYSFHSLIIDDDKIVGLNSYAPVYYYVNGKRLLFVNSIDSMIQKEYRDFFNYKDMVSNANKNMASEDVCFVYGYPNDNAFPVVIKSRIFKHIGDMYTYCLPYRIGGIKPSLKWLNPLSIVFSKSFVYLSSLFVNKKEYKFSVFKDSESYNLSRYKRSDGKYIKVEINNMFFYLKIVLHEGIRTLFLIDISDKNPKTFHIALKYILTHYSKDFDLILYPGYLPFLNSGFIKIPHKYEPKKFHLAGYVIRKDLIDFSDIWEIKNWDTNLSNYDLI